MIILKKNQFWFWREQREFWITSEIVVVTYLYYTYKTLAESMWLKPCLCVRARARVSTRRELLVRDTRRWQGDVKDCRSAGSWKRCMGKSHFSQFLFAIGARIPAQIHKYLAMPPSLSNSLFNWKLAFTKL